MSKLIQIVTLLWVSMALLIAGASALGEAIWTPPVLLSMIDLDCETPCWQGIRPGETTLDEALAVLSHALAPAQPRRGGRASPSFWRLNESAADVLGIAAVGINTDASVVRTVVLHRMNKPVAVGDIVAYLGLPRVVTLPTTAALFYPEQGVRVYIERISCEPRRGVIPPSSRIYSVAIGPAPGSQPWRTADLWAGFRDSGYC
jgi:hypothetical protein